jgi:outer membrane protein assembly factor BamE
MATFTDSISRKVLYMKKLILLTMAAVFLSSCAILRPHKPTVEQGNIFTQSEIDRLHTGMSEAAVRELMGDPVTVTLLSDNRLSYIYTMQKGYENMTIKRVMCEFSNGRLVEIRRY